MANPLFLLSLAKDSINCQGYTISRREVPEFVRKYTMERFNSPKIADEVVACIDDDFYREIGHRLHVESESTDRYTKFVGDFKRLESMMKEVGAEHCPIFGDDEDHHRNELMECCIERTLELYEHTCTMRDILRQGHKGYEDMTDLELINDWLEGSDIQFDEMWFGYSINVAIEKAVNEKSAIMMEQALGLSK